MPTGGEQPWFFDKFVRYEIDIVYPVLFKEKTVSVYKVLGPLLYPAKD